VVVLGRRGPAEAAFTVPELVGLAGLRDVDVVVEGAADLLTGGSPRQRLLADLAARPRVEGRRTIVLRFLTSPVEILGAERVSGVRVVRNALETGADGVPRAVPTGESEVISAGLVLRAVGYRGEPVRDLPYDAGSGTVPNDRGRVRPGVYVAGWVKRGPTGFIGTNKSCAEETVTRILDDLDSGAVGDPVGTPASIQQVVRGRCPELVDLAGWRAIDAEERRRGAARGRARVKIVDTDELRRVAGTASVRATRPATLTARRRREKRG
jgi:ferredoxin--NADP+ reductase